MKASWWKFDKQDIGIIWEYLSLPQRLINYKGEFKVGKPGRLIKVNMANGGMTHIWCEAERNTAPSLRCSCQERMASIWSWANIENTQVEGHPTERKPMHSKLSRNERQGEADKLFQTEGVWKDMTTKGNVYSWIGSWTKKETLTLLGQLVKFE